MVKMRQVKGALREQLIVASIAVFLCSSGAHADQWIRTYGGTDIDRARCIQQTRDGGYIVAGRTYSFDAGAGDIWVLKLYGNGEVDWQKTYGGEHYDEAECIQQTLDGGYIVSGTTYSSFDAWAGDIWVLKLYGNGEVDWEYAYGGEHYEGAKCIQQTRDGGYIVAGWTDSLGSPDIWVLKLYGNGEVDWQYAYGGEHYEEAEFIQQTLDGGYIVAGTTDSILVAGDIWVLKLDGNGEIDWQYTYGGEYSDRAKCIQQTRDGDYIVAGTTESFGASPPDIWVLKLDGNGEIDWQYTYGGRHYEDAEFIQQTLDGDYIVAGTTESFGASPPDIWVLKLDGNGEVDCEKAYGGEYLDLANCIQQTRDGDYIVAGTTYYLGAEWLDICVLKLNNMLNIFNCAAAGESEATRIPTSIDRIETTVQEEPTTLPHAPTEPAVNDSEATITEVCYFRTPLFLEFEWDSDRIIWCLKEPLPGVSLPRCGPPGCLECLFRFSEYAELNRIPGYLADVCWEMSPLLTRGYPKFPESSIKRLETLFNKVPIGSHYTETLKSSVLKSLNEIRIAKQITPQYLGKLVEAINTIELDLSVPALPTVEVKAGKYSAVDFEGVAWVAFNDIKESGKASLKIKSGLPASVRGFEPPWPIFSYDLNFTGALAEDGCIDISFYFGGINIMGKLTNLRIFEWDGKSYKDITTNVDLRTKVISGRTSRLSTFVIMNAMPRGKETKWRKCGN